MAASPAYRLAQASDTRAFGFLVSLALHAGVLAAYGLWSHSPRLIPERREEPRTVTIMTLPSLETEQPSARRPKAAPRPANQLTPPNTTPATRAGQGPQASPDRPASDQAALTLPVAPSPLPARMNVDMPHPQPASPQAASSTLSAARAAYLRRLWEWIAARRPAGLHLEGEALINFSIGPDGALRGLSLAQSSGNTQLDRLALRTVRLAAPFPRPPESLDAEKLDFVLPFHFN